MISALIDFCRTEALPRWAALLISTEMTIAAGLAILFGLFGSGSGIAGANTGDVVFVLLAYAAIGFGFSVAGLTLVLTAPDRNFAAELAWSDPSEDGLAEKPPKSNSYGNLLFIFAWTAVAHWGVVIGSFALLFAMGHDTPLSADGSSVKHRVVVSVVVFVTVYAAELFLITVITLTQVGHAYIDRLQRSRPTEPS